MHMSDHVQGPIRQTTIRTVYRLKLPASPAEVEELISWTPSDLADEATVTFDENAQELVMTLSEITDSLTPADILNAPPGTLIAVKEAEVVQEAVYCRTAAPRGDSQAWSRAGYHYVSDEGVEMWTREGKVHLLRWGPRRESSGEDSR
jgi:hypothetical protein